MKYSEWKRAIEIWPTIACSLLVGFTIWNKIRRLQQDGDAPILYGDLVLSDEDAYRISKTIYEVRALLLNAAPAEWITTYRAEQQRKQDFMEAAEDGGFSVTHFDNST